MWPRRGCYLDLPCGTKEETFILGSVIIHVDNEAYPHGFRGHSVARGLSLDPAVNYISCGQGIVLVTPKQWLRPQEALDFVNG